jgi:osmotically-inducible protein OsmY
MRRPMITAAVFAAALLLVPAAYAADPQTRDVTPLFANGGVAFNGFRAIDVGGILILRGRTADRAQAEAAGLYAQTLGYTRVANLVQIAEPVNDAVIERQAERQLALHRSLDGCDIRVSSQDGVVKISGRVQQELQKDMAIQVIRNVDGVKSVSSELQR